MDVLDYLYAARHEDGPSPQLARDFNSALILLRAVMEQRNTGEYPRGLHNIKYVLDTFSMGHITMMTDTFQRFEAKPAYMAGHPAFDYAWPLLLPGGTPLIPEARDALRAIAYRLAFNLHIEEEKHKAETIVALTMGAPSFEALMDAPCMPTDPLADLHGQARRAWPVFSLQVSDVDLERLSQMVKTPAGLRAELDAIVRTYCRRIPDARAGRANCTFDEANNVYTGDIRLGHMRFDTPEQHAIKWNSGGAQGHVDRLLLGRENPEPFVSWLSQAIEAKTKSGATLPMTITVVHLRDEDEQLPLCVPPAGALRQYAGQPGKPAPGEDMLETSFRQYEARLHLHGLPSPSSPAFEQLTEARLQVYARHLIKHPSTRIYPSMGNAMDCVADAADAVNAVNVRLQLHKLRDNEHCADALELARRLLVTFVDVASSAQSQEAARSLGQFARNLAREAGIPVQDAFAIHAKVNGYKTYHAWSDAVRIWRNHSTSRWHGDFVRNGAAVLTVFWEQRQLDMLMHMAEEEPEHFLTHLHWESQAASDLMVEALASRQGWHIDDDGFLLHAEKQVVHIGDPRLSGPGQAGHSLAAGMFDMLLCGREHPVAFLEHYRNLQLLAKKYRIGVPFSMTIWVGNGFSKLPLPAAGNMNGRVPC